jgi:hypothetical protein
MVDTPSLIVSLRRTYRYQGKTYGPGADIEVPYGLAASLGLLPRVPATVSAPVSAPTVAGEFAVDALPVIAEPEPIGGIDNAVSELEALVATAGPTVPGPTAPARRGRKPKDSKTPARD